ncbi:MAG: 1-deoxy-D-xylulose-5-phosphate reductoisomerase, partial [Actinomycetota bacterium]
MSTPRDVIILGSTGSIGVQALDVLSRNPDRFRVVGLAAGGGRPEILHEQARAFGVSRAALGADAAAELAGTGCDV